MNKIIRVKRLKPSALFYQLNIDINEYFHLFFQYYLEYDSKIKLILTQNKFVGDYFSKQLFYI